MLHSMQFTAPSLSAAIKFIFVAFAFYVRVSDISANFQGWLPYRCYTRLCGHLRFSAVWSKCICDCSHLPPPTVKKSGRFPQCDIFLPSNLKKKDKRGLQCIQIIRWGVPKWRTSNTVNLRAYESILRLWQKKTRTTICDHTAFKPTELESPDCSDFKVFLILLQNLSNRDFLAQFV